MKKYLHLISRAVLISLCFLMPALALVQAVGPDPLCENNGQNRRDRFDVTREGRVTPMDGFFLIDYLTRSANGESVVSDFCYDVNGDDRISLGDVRQLVARMQNPNTTDEVVIEEEEATVVDVCPNWTNVGLPADVNKDGVVNSDDSSVMVLRMLSSEGFGLLGLRTNPELPCYDVNGDGSVDGQDSGAIFTYVPEAVSIEPAICSELGELTLDEAQPELSRVRVTWGASTSSEVTEYKLSVFNEDGTAFFRNRTSNGLSRMATGVIPGSSYTYSVVAVDGDGNESEPCVDPGSFTVAVNVVEACGNSELEEGEQCDDGNLENGDGCSVICESQQDLRLCGNGRFDFGESCDTGSAYDYVTDGCTDLCRYESPGKAILAPYSSNVPDGGTVAEGDTVGYYFNLYNRDFANHVLTFEVDTNLVFGNTQTLPGLSFSESEVDGKTILEIELPGRNTADSEHYGSFQFTVPANTGQELFVNIRAHINGEDVTLPVDGMSSTEPLVHKGDFNYFYASACGNGLVENNEQCDDGNAIPGDGCDEVCVIEVVSIEPAVCLDLGELALDEAQPELSRVRVTWGASTSSEVTEYKLSVFNEDGTAFFRNRTSNGLSRMATGVIPGSSYTYSVVAVDGDGNESEPCVDPGSFTVAVNVVEACGNDNIDPGETCDDGNLENGDGCDEACVIELPEVLNILDIARTDTMDDKSIVAGVASEMFLEFSIDNTGSEGVVIDSILLKGHATGASVDNLEDFTLTLFAGGTQQGGSQSFDANGGVTFGDISVALGQELKTKTLWQRLLSNIFVQESSSENITVVVDTVAAVAGTQNIPSTLRLGVTEVRGHTQSTNLSVIKTLPEDCESLSSGSICGAIVSFTEQPTNWVQYSDTADGNARSCADICTAEGKAAGTDEEGYSCVSGLYHPAGVDSSINFIHGCAGNDCDLALGAAASEDLTSGLNLCFDLDSFPDVEVPELTTEAFSTVGCYCE